MKYRSFEYTKDSGEVSDRRVLIVSEARENHLCYDVTDMGTVDLLRLQRINEYLKLAKEDMLENFEQDTGIKLDKLWRSFKPSGIKWNGS